MEIALITIIAGASSVLFTRLRFPAVIGYIVAGMVLVLLFSLMPVFLSQRADLPFVVIFIALGVLLGYLIWDYLHSSYRRMSTVLTKHLVEDGEEHE
jgi:Kef-type K+ transport system membrane component KefB